MTREQPISRYISAADVFRVFAWVLTCSARPGRHPDSPERGAGPGADDGRIHAGFHGSARGSNKPLHLIIEGKDIHGDIEFFPGPVRGLDGLPEFFRAEIARICPQAVLFHGAVYRVRPEVQRGFQRFPVSRRAQQFRHHS